MTGRRRRAGILIPLFSFPSTRSWGIGEIPDIAPMTAWLAAAGQTVLQLLPLNEMASGQQSPYSAMSAMAIDPIFIAVADVPEFEGLDAGEGARLRQVQAAPRVDHAGVRALKQRALRRAFERFVAHEWRRRTPRAAELAAFLDRESWWIRDYALYRALHDREDRRPWTAWPAELRRRDPDALAACARELGDEVLFYQYLQWIAGDQWARTRAAARANGVQLVGDLPFMVDGDSADVWARQEVFRLEASVGVPPDAFSDTGQDWGMPAYNWRAMADSGFAWLRARARRSAVLFDGYRVDHLVGFYRTYSRPRAGGAASFEPADPGDQRVLGEQVLAVFAESGAAIIAEDLGVVPDFVRESLARLGVPGFRVFRWERRWHEPEQRFLDPASYPAVSVAASGTHDTEPLAVWWDHAPGAERQAIARVPSVRDRSLGRDLVEAAYNPIVRDTLLDTLFASGSDLVLLPIQDVFGWRDRINVPATVTVENWTFRLPWPIDRINDDETARERQAALRAWAERYGRI